MSKYIIEIKPEYEDSFKGVMILGAKDSNLFVDTLAVEDLEELNSDYINEHFGELQDTAYQKGFEDGVTKRIDGDACIGCKYKGNPNDNPCKCCSNGYPNQWTAKDDRIEVGDIVERYLDDKLDSTGIYLGNADEKGDYWNCLFWTGASYITLGYPKHQFKKTGRHFDIQSILEGMRND